MFRVLGAILVLAVLPGCDVITAMFQTRAGPVDASEAIHDAAMADFSTCQTAADPAARATAAARLAWAAVEMQTMERPRNPDHFYMSDRVASAAEFCAAAAQ